MSGPRAGRVPHFGATERGRHRRARNPGRRYERSRRLLMGGATHWLHLTLFGSGAEHGPSAMREVDPFIVLLVPMVGGLLLGLLNLGLARWWPRTPIDPIEANALYGGRPSLADGAVVGAQHIVSNGFGASVGLEAAYAQAGGGLAARVGRAFGGSEEHTSELQS